MVLLPLLLSLHLSLLLSLLLPLLLSLLLFILLLPFPPQERNGERRASSHELRAGREVREVRERERVGEVVRKVQSEVSVRGEGGRSGLVGRSPGQVTQHLFVLFLIVFFVPYIN